MHNIIFTFIVYKTYLSFSILVQILGVQNISLSCERVSSFPLPSSLVSFSSSVVAAIQAKDVTHIWELGGGTHLVKLLDVPITAETIR